MGAALAVLFFLLVPAVVLWACRRVKVLGKIGPVLLLYFIGVLFGNTFHPAGLDKVQDLLSSAMIPLAIPLMLFACKLSLSRTRSQLLAMVTGLFAVVVTVALGYVVFGRHNPEGAKIGGMLTGCYTGGTINLAAITERLGVDDATFILVNSCDMLICFLYLTFLLSFGIKLFRRWLPVETLGEDGCGNIVPEDAPANPYKGILTRQGRRDLGVLLVTDLAAIGISALLALLLPDGWFMTVFILVLTTLGIAGSFFRQIRERKYGYDVGMYLIYVFSVVVASMADLSKFNLLDSLELLGYLAVVVFGSLFLQLLLAKLFRIDADTTVVCSVTYICSPPFVPMMAAAMKNRNVLAAGLAIGVVGYAVGNYLGFLMARFLPLLNF